MESGVTSLTENSSSIPVNEDRPVVPPKDRLEPRGFVLRAKSVNYLSRMASAATLPPHRDGSFRPSAFVDTTVAFNTIADPRSPSPTPSLKSPTSEGELSAEVTMLSTKLIHAINHGTGLDDTLHTVRQELAVAYRRLEELDNVNERYSQDIANGALLKKAEVDATIQLMRRELGDARRQREEAEKAKKQMESEVENLTASLFEQANTMVADARRESEAIEKRNAQLRSQLQDTEMLLSSQQEQLHDLKGVMERMTSERDETETAPHILTAPSTPAIEMKMSKMMDSMPVSPGTTVEFTAQHPLRYSHLLVPLMRTDVGGYLDFAELLKASRPSSFSSSHQRSSSGNLSANKSSPSGSLASNPAASYSAPHLPESYSQPPTPATGSPRDQTMMTNIPALKDSKIWKRTLAEDIEPVLRLDLAPGLSWLARRAVLTSIISGALVIEPFSTTPKLSGPLAINPCALCGEDRPQDIYARRHRTSVSDDPSSQRYPLCEYCLNRLRATCDFVSFLRMCRDGTWKANTEEEVRYAWEEATKLRESMFWARLGGGAVPTHSLAAAERSRKSLDRSQQGHESSDMPKEDENMLTLTTKPTPIVRLSTPPIRSNSVVAGAAVEATTESNNQ